MASEKDTKSCKKSRGENSAILPIFVGCFSTFANICWLLQVALNQFKSNLDRGVIFHIFIQMFPKIHNCYYNPHSGATYIFPLMFAIFNAVYWVLYLYVIRFCHSLYTKSSFSFSFILTTLIPDILMIR